jgi:hypothetical protein
MPFFAHIDLFSEYRRIFYALDNDIFSNTHRVVTFYIELIFAWLMQIFVPISEATFYLPDPSKSTASNQDYLLFLQDPYIYRYLFFFKLPYLLFDLAVAWVIWNFMDKAEPKRLAVLIWLFNPLTLFATYIFGRFEVFSIFFLAVTAWQLKSHRIFLASLAFAISLHCREINLMFAPFLLLAVIDFKDPVWRNLMVLGLCACIIFVVLLLPDWLIPSFGNTNLFVDPSQNFQHDATQKLFSLGYYWFYPIIFGLVGVAVYNWESGAKSHAERFIISAALALFVYFAFNVHSVHYASWLVLFPILSIHYNKHVIVPFLVLFIVWVLMWLLKTDAGVFTPFLAAPLSPELIGPGHFPSYFNEKLATPSLSLGRAIESSRTLCAASMAFFAIRLIKS